MRILIGCEQSGIVRTAFEGKGHDVWSCDVVDTSIPGQHIKGDVLEVLDQGWDMGIFFPPCTHLCVSGARWFKEKAKDGRQEKALNFIRQLMNAPINHIAIENPIGIISSTIQKPDQIIQPWMFGDQATKATCLWLKKLPLLKPTKIVSKGERHITKSGRSLPKWYNLPPSKHRSTIRSKTFQGIASAMGDQWGSPFNFQSSILEVIQ